jgi:hypothetical protein
MPRGGDGQFGGVPLVTRPRVLGLGPWARSSTSFDRRRSAHEGQLVLDHHLAQAVLDAGNNAVVTAHNAITVTLCTTCWMDWLVR